MPQYLGLLGAVIDWYGLTLLVKSTRRYGRLGWCLNSGVADQYQGSQGLVVFTVWHWVMASKLPDDRSIRLLVLETVPFWTLWFAHNYPSCMPTILPGHFLVPHPLPSRCHWIASRSDQSLSGHLVLTLAFHGYSLYDVCTFLNPSPWLLIPAFPYFLVLGDIHLSLKVLPRSSMTLYSSRLHHSPHLGLTWECIHSHVLSKL